jgi:hypothetical protein
MKIPVFDDKNYKICSCCSCEFSKNVYISTKCLHKLCDNCYKNKMSLLDSIYECKLCQSENKNNSMKLKRSDFKPNSNNNLILEEFYRNDKLKREQIIYKRRENFHSQEEYNDFLEYVENCLKRNNLDDINKKYTQSDREKEINEKSLKDKLESIKNKIADPTSYNNSKFVINLDEGIPIQEEIINDPIVIIEETINYIKDEEKEKICGGYNINKIYGFLGTFSKGGFRNTKTIN